MRLARLSVLFVAFQVEKHLPAVQWLVAVHALFQVLPFIVFGQKEKLKIIFLIVVQYFGLIVGINRKETCIVLEIVIAKFFYDFHQFSANALSAKFR